MTEMAGRAVLGREPVHEGTLAASLTALGVVYGDLGTSPLYTMQTVVQAMGGKVSTESALGVLSLIVWTLLITVSLKYCLFVMRADNRGEGGILALMSLVGANTLRGKTLLLTSMGLIGACLIYGDGVITPAISVLSALEGVNVVTDTLKPFILPLALAILIILFLGQRLGTSKIGNAFGPIMVLWFLSIGLLGLRGVIRNPVVLRALAPTHAITFLVHSGPVGPLVLGAVFLCTTGAEALYADMGHIGKRPIQLSWYALVLPALLLSYAGQTGLLIEKGSVSANPFFQLAPAPLVLPLVILATAATIIASQAIITGAFSMTRQAIQLGWLPSMRIRQTSDRIYGQIYVPLVNWLMMIATVGVALAFRTSDHLSGAYGTAVSTTMLMTTGLLFDAMVRVWKWPIWVSVLIAGFFLIVDLAFFSANLLKIADGGWLPLALGGTIFFLMTTWRQGLDAVRASIQSMAEPADVFLKMLEQGHVPRVPGTAVFLTRATQKIPNLIVEHVRHMGALHQNVIALTLSFEDCPRIGSDHRTSIEPIGEGIWRAHMAFGFIEIPDLQAALSEIKDLPPEVDLKNAIFFGTRDQVVRKPGSSLFTHWRLPFFAFLYRNAVKVVDRFHLPPANVVEIARQIEI
jgi:KUP system potassium uptake protein